MVSIAMISQLYQNINNDLLRKFFEENHYATIIDMEDKENKEMDIEVIVTDTYQDDD